MWAIFLSLYWICYSIAPVLCVCVCVCVFGQKACGISASPTRDQTCTPTLEGKVLTNGPPGKSQKPIWKIGKHKLVQSERVEKKICHEIATQNEAEVGALISDDVDFRQKKKGILPTLKGDLVSWQHGQFIKNTLLSPMCKHLTELQNTWSINCTKKKKIYIYIHTIIIEKFETPL